MTSPSELNRFLFQPFSQTMREFNSTLTSRASAAASGIGVSSGNKALPTTKTGNKITTHTPGGFTIDQVAGANGGQDDGRIGLQMNVSDERTDPLMSDKTIDQRSTRMRAGADIRDDEILVLVASTYAIGRENKTEPRVRLILLSARCSSCNSGSGS